MLKRIGTLIYLANNLQLQTIYALRLGLCLKAERGDINSDGDK
jgi:hypothetical protein